MLTNHSLEVFVQAYKKGKHKLKPTSIAETQKPYETETYSVEDKTFKLINILSPYVILV